MDNIYEESGFVPIAGDYLDLEVFRKEHVQLISMKKNKGDKKAFRQASNHLDAGLVHELQAALQRAAADPGCEAIIISSSHKVAFSRGARIEALAGVGPADAHAFIQGVQQLILDIQRCPKPVLAAITGLTFGGGLELALACDYRLSSSRDNVVFGFPEAALGVIPAMGGTQNLARVIGKDKAFDIIANARIGITPAAALELGLVARLVEPEQLVNEAFTAAGAPGIKKALQLEEERLTVSGAAIQKEIASWLQDRARDVEIELTVAPLARALIEFIFAKTDERHYLDGLKYEEEVICYLQQTQDFQEGIRALQAERKPVFKGA
jgi:enoyl-CoA hydratase/carnithine racemase